ncbi:restriction endonuclease subunit S [Atlantibacter hermannii]|uniref:restriction endonuclease subunit S n=1 Tax=Atlantibacter hermannii TaxID=565 RepID=UPI0028AED58C|nr:restriction endonuclease subunit S [Atlantibacter hermannii]
MAKYKAYPKYKDSGVEWLGAIPEDWSVTKLKYIADLLTAKYTNSDDLFVGLENISSGDGKYISKEENIADGASVSFEKNDVLFGKLRPYLAKSWLATFSGVCSSEFLVLRTAKLHPKYLNYYSLTNEFIEQVNSSTYGSKMPRASWEFIGLLPVPTCSYSLSEKVACFLDHETAKIDNLIEKQQQLVELLKEKRQSVISHAVTKGLNPDVPMKDSGVEWLGEVPDHWELVPLKYLCNFSGGGTPTKDNLSYWQGGSVPWVSPKDMKSFWISETQDYVTPKAVSESSTNYIEEGSLLMVVRSGILQRNIPVAINIVKVTMNQDMKALRFNERMKAHYAAYFINGNVNSLLLEWTKEGATVESIEHEYLANGLIPVPPIDEQHSIIKSISGQMIRFELLEEKALTGIRLLQERRTALISAAVTGKIDVRDWVAPDTQDLEEPQEAIA